MAFSNNLNTFSDVRKVFDAAVERGGVRYRLGSKKEAMYFRHRAYHYRKLLFKQAEANSIVPGQHAATPYDDLVISIEDSIVFVRPMELKGVIEDLSGNTVEMKEEDPLLLEAEEFKKGLLGGFKDD